MGGSCAGAAAFLGVVPLLGEAPLGEESLDEVLRATGFGDDVRAFGGGGALEGGHRPGATIPGELLSAASCEKVSERTNFFRMYETDAQALLIAGLTCRRAWRTAAVRADFGLSPFHDF